MLRPTSFLFCLVILMGGFGCERNGDTQGEAGSAAPSAKPTPEVVSDSEKQAAAAGQSAADEPRSLRFVLFPLITPINQIGGVDFSATALQIDTIQSDGSVHGTLHIDQELAARFAKIGIPPKIVSTLSEGYYLGLDDWRYGWDVNEWGSPWNALGGAGLYRVQVTQVEEGGAVWIQLAPAALEHVAKGDILYLTRPAGSSTAELKAVPDAVRLPVLGMDAATAACYMQSTDNLHKIGLALENFHEQNGHFPPATVYGPDGKPWHSWRVLLLPYLEEKQLYDQYKFDESWDGPNNTKLLERMPSVYRDPVHGESEDYFTHYAVASGPGTAFPSEGKHFNGTAKDLFDQLKETSGTKARRDIVDGTSNTILVGSISPDRRVPWMKPEDVTFSDTFPQQGGFAAPYKIHNGMGGVFLQADCAAGGIRNDIHPQIWRNLVQIADGRNTPSALLGFGPSGFVQEGTFCVIEIDRNETGVTARAWTEFFEIE